MDSFLIRGVGRLIAILWPYSVSLSVIFALFSPFPPCSQIDSLAPPEAVAPSASPLSSLDAPLRSFSPPVQIAIKAGIVVALGTLAVALVKYAIKYNDPKQKRSRLVRA